MAAIVGMLMLRSLYACSVRVYVKFEVNCLVLVRCMLMCCIDDAHFARIRSVHGPAQI